MRTTAYGERDYTFGQAMLTLRTAIGLTQAGLASALGVSRRAVGEWEAGSSYPKAQHLKELIALGVKRQAFTAGHEAEEIRALWKVACQKVFLDESWLAELLSQQRSSHLHIVPHVREEGVTGALVGEQESRQGTSPASAAAGPRVDWGDALAVPIFYGREQELARLAQWVVQERCRVISVVGMGGIGKSALSVSAMYQQAEHFEVVIFRSLRDAPSCEALLSECLQVLSPQELCAVSTGQTQGEGSLGTWTGANPIPTEQTIGLLLSHLRKTRVLVVLDNLESLLEAGDVRGRFRPGFEGYGQLLRLVAETGHQSCLLLTSREKPADLRLLEGKYPSVCSLRLEGLDVAACKLLFVEQGVVGTELEQESLIKVYGGNPLALKMVAETIGDLFGGQIGEFLAAGEMVLFGGITDLLDEQFARLSALEQSVLCWLAIAREAITLDELLQVLVTPLPRTQILEAVNSLRQRSLIERGKRAGSFTLQSVVLEYVTGALIAEGSREIQQHQLHRLVQHGLELAHAKEYVRQTQERLLLLPLLTNLQNASLRQTGRATEFVSLEEQLLALLEGLRGRVDPVQGYGPANLIALLRVLRGHLNALDLSHLCIRGAYLQGVQMQDTSLRGTLVRESVFTQAVSSTWTVAISPDGRWWAAGSLQGIVCIWECGQFHTPHLSLLAHTDMVVALAFSPDGLMLASGSADGTVKLWNMEAYSHGADPHDVLLWAGWHSGLLSLAFSSDGSLLASGGMDATVRLWDSQGGQDLQTLTHPGPVFAVAFSPDRSLLASGCVDGQLRLWEGQQGSPASYALLLSVQTNWVSGLAFAPDGRTLASTSRGDQTVKLWEVASLCLLHTLPGHTEQSRCVAWSPDGRTLAYGSIDKTIWLWDVVEGRCRAVLHGHSSDVYGMVFTLDGTGLLSGSADSTLRVWDVESCRCVRIVRGYGVCLYDLAWSPDGTQLVSGGMDGLVTVWDMSNEMPPRNLRGHSWIVSGVRWSPDGRFIASCGLDTALCLWDSTTHSCVQRFEEPNVVLLSMAWSPKGRLLACGTCQRGAQVWDVTARSLCGVGPPSVVWFLRVAWSPDGTRLGGAAHDGSVYLWENNEGTWQQKLLGQHSDVMSMAWSPDGARLACGSGGRSSGELIVWDVESGGGGQVQGTIPTSTFAECPERVYAVAWSSGGDQLISGGNNGRLYCWDVETGECVRVRDAHHGTIRSLKVSPDGKLLASCGEDGAIGIWDMTSFEHVRTLRHDRPYEQLNITGIRGLSEVEKATMQALGAIEDSANT